MSIEQGTGYESTPGRPVMDAFSSDAESARAAATDAVDQLVAGLQDALNRGDADAYDRQFAADVLWGSPYGATVRGFAELNPIHHWLMGRHAAPPSRYRVVQLMCPLPGVAIAQVRRDDLTEQADKRFSEMAMYVLIKRDAQWWLAAGQNTPIADPPA
jgi:uncharacterized protein (TIGR02246 family)